MRAACFCGACFEADEDLAFCPRCGAPALLPKLPPSRVRKDLEADIRFLQAEGIPSDW